MLGFTEGLFLREVRSVAGAYPTSSTTMNSSLTRWRHCSFVTPSRFDVIVTTNMFGDILSDEAAELSGSLGLAASINFGERHCMAQAQHGSAPDIQGQNKANPTSLVLSSAMLIGLAGSPASPGETSRRPHASSNSRWIWCCSTPARRTIDLGGPLGTDAFTSELCKEIDARARPLTRRRDILREDAATIEHRAFMKAAWRLVPFVTVGYLLNYMDRNNVGFAALTMNRDDRIDGDRVRLRRRSALFRLQLLRDPQQHGALPVRRATLDRANHDHVGHRVGRHGVRARPARAGTRCGLLLGVAEAGFFPGITFYLATWFPAEYRARMLAWFLVAIPRPPSSADPISGLVLQMDGSVDSPGWQWLFIIEGLPATLSASRRFACCPTALKMRRS